MIYQPVIEKTDNTYCILRVFKHPYTGELRDCTGERKPAEGRVAYTPGTVRVDEAWQLACAHAQANSSLTCGPGGIWEVWTLVRRGDGDSLHYIVLLRLGSPLDFLVYRVDAIKRDVTFLEGGRDQAALNMRYGY
jgi:hypothetical protein